MRFLNYGIIIAAVFLAFSLSAEAGENIREAIAIIHPVAGEKVTGKIHIRPHEEGLEFSGRIVNLKPGSHGLHVHRFGNCTAPNDGSVGPHFAPIAESEKYYGDLPHVTADMNGRADYEEVAGTLDFSGKYSVIGRGLVIHGLDGKKIGCAVIGIAK